MLIYQVTLSGVIPVAAEVTIKAPNREKAAEKAMELYGLDFRPVDAVCGVEVLSVKEIEGGAFTNVDAVVEEDKHEEGQSRA